MDASLIGLFILGGLFLSSCLFALRWAVKSGQFQHLEGGARVIFTAEEPEGVIQDHFPEKTSPAVSPRA